MGDTVTDETVDTVSGALARAGGTSRLELRLPAGAADDFPAGEVVRLVVDGAECHAELSRTADGQPVVRGAYDTPSLARDPGSAEDRLAAWVVDSGLEAGRTVHVDVVEPGYKYGVRAPGESARYESVAAPSSSLADIARSLDEG
ncbi:DUF7112 family protein [Halobacterium yunchengense]|uniref:DUF7112 family protein n=1 Tax=Halobacterium yunchengense TaxID=3108497 RepID=UPI00300843A2